MEIIIPLVAGALIYNAIKTEDPKLNTPTQW